MDSEKKENCQESVATIQHGPAGVPPPPPPPDSPIDLSQLSTRYRSVDLSNRSVSESCLAPAAAAAKKRRIQGFKDPLPPPLLAEHRVPDSLKYRSMSHADITGYRTPWLSGDSPESVNNPIQPKTSLVEKMTTTPEADESSPTAESLKFRCMSDSRLGGAGHVSSAFHPTTSSGNSSNRKTFMSNSDLLRAAATDNSQLEFLLRRTASESFISSRYVLVDHPVCQEMGEKFTDVPIKVNETVLCVNGLKPVSI